MKTRLRPLNSVLLASALLAALSLLTMLPQQSLALEVNQPQRHKLRDDHSLVLSTNVQGQARLDLLWNNHLQEAMLISNADFTDTAVVQRTLCQDCQPAYVITAYDRSSTYGATTLFVVDTSLGWWSLHKLPFDRAVCEDRDHDGLFEFHDLRQKRGYRWQNGLLLALPSH